MPLAVGTQLGPYEIVGALGEGGMGEVYRARDVNLGREVAVKVLPEAFASDPERVARFEREARVLASLNHPNIATIHGLERATVQSFLIMELVAGETLASRIARGRIPTDEALPLAAQIAAALEAAHEKNVVHRDLKPANIAVTPDGKVKVLDFGLAKALADEARAIDLSQSPTMTQGPSSSGMILGTAAYMSPEQARGKAVDKRADIWALGCVLYEMLTGKAAFTGETLTDIIAAVVKNEPEWAALPADTPAAIRTLLRRCLKKDPLQRVHDAGDARIEIEEALGASGAEGPKGRAGLERVLLLSAIALLAVALLAQRFSPRNESTAPRVVRLELNLPANLEISGTNTPSFAISPDGRRIAVAAALGGLRRIYLRRIDEFEATPLKGTETANTCFFSPDGNALAFVTPERILKKISLVDGLVTDILRGVDYFGGGVWGPDDRITFGRDGTLWQVPASGGSAQQLTTLDSDSDERLQLWPTVVNDGSAVLFTSVSGTQRTATHIDAFSFAMRQRHRIVESGSNPMFALSGHVVFFRDGRLLAIPFDKQRLQATGPEAALLDDISLDQLGSPMVALSDAGTFAYVASRNSTKRLVWVTREGVEQPITTVNRPYQNPRLAPDGKRIVVEVAGGDLWMQDTTRATITRLTAAETIGNTFAAWTPDAHRVVFRTLTGLRWIDPDGGGGSQPIPGTSVVDIPSSVSPDGQILAFIRQSEAASDLYAVSLTGEVGPHPIVSTSGYDGGGQFSPDGRWLAYVSNESGQFEVYVRPYPTADRRATPLSTQTGTHPRWNPAGKELFYRSGDRMMVVDVATSPDLKLSQPRVLFEQRYSFGSAQTIANYDVSPDGKRFVMVKDDSASGRLNLVLNWFEELKRLAPTQAR
jgi:eukaryotic-like serine/threonine-protein kinase